MARKMGRDTWLYSNTRSGQRIIKAAKANEGRLEQPASDFTNRMLTDIGRPRITNWGAERGRNSDGTVISISKSAVPVEKELPDYPSTKQLKDPFEGLYSQGIALEPPLPPDRLLNLTEENTLHSGCLMAKAYDSCGRGWSFEPKEGMKGNKALLASDLPDKLKLGMEVLTPELTFGEMLYQATWEMEAIGWSVWECVRLTEQFSPGAYAQIGAIYPIPSFTMRATIDPRRWVQIRAGRVRFFKKFGAKCEIDAETGQVYEWESRKDLETLGTIDPDRFASEIIVFKSYTPRSLWYGIPKWIAAVPTIAELSAIREFNVSWFASGGQTDYILHFKAASLDTAKKMAEDVKQQMQEYQGRGHTNIVVAGSEDSDMDVQKLGELLREGHFRFRRGDLAKEVLIAHNVPPYRIGWAETGSLAGNAAQEMLGAYKYGAIVPLQNIIQDRLNWTLFDADIGISTGDFRLKLAELQLDDLSQELAGIVQKVDSAIMTPNQAREELGLDAVDEEDDLSGQAEDMNKYYFKGSPLGQSSPMAGGIGPDGKPLAPKPFGGTVGGFKPDGTSAPNEPPKVQEPEQTEQKSAVGPLEVIAAFEKTLRDVLRSEEPAVARETDTPPSPSERRPSRRKRQQSI